RTTYVQPGENLELVLGDFFSVVSRPVLTNLRITLPGIGVSEQFPATLGDLYHGQQIIIAGQFNTTATGPVKLSAVREGEALEYVWPDVSFMNTAEASYVPSVWAGRKISYLIDQIRTHGESQEMIAEIVQLSQSRLKRNSALRWGGDGAVVVRRRDSRACPRRCGSPCDGMPRARAVALAAAALPAPAKGSMTPPATASRWAKPRKR
ncbi:MAG: hypothetical protein ACYTEY_10050, partial [Planctomycetota bacterium]